MDNGTEKQQDIIGTMDNTMVLGIQKVIADLNRQTGFRIQLTNNIDFMLFIDAMERCDKDNVKLKKICAYLRLREMLKTFNLIQKTMHGMDLLLLIGEQGGEKISFDSILKELLGGRVK